MPNQFQASTIMVHHSAILESLEPESEPFRGIGGSQGIIENP